MISKREATQTTSLFTPRRELGRTGFIASVLGIGDLADRGMPLRPAWPRCAAPSTPG
jgi:hypothetical protein